MKNIKNSYHKTSAAHTILMILLSPRILIQVCITVRIILRDFFYLQTCLVPRRKRPPFVNIDHEIDKNIPFAPEWVEIYMSFIGLWVYTVTWMFFTFKRKSIPYIVKSLKEVKQIYLTAGSVYKICQSTTTRPEPVKGDRTFALIHRMDPHLNCMPSLHVMIVTWAAFSLVPRITELASDYSDKSDIREITDYIIKRAGLITESILYIKQHSINCIPAALYVMQNLFPGFENQYGKTFINKLFKTSHPPVKDRKKLITFMEKLFDRFCNENPEQDFRQKIINFLNSYPKQYR